MADHPINGSREIQRKLLHYLDSLRTFLADTPNDCPLGPWLASLTDDELDRLIGAIDDYTRVSGKMDDRLFSDVLAVVVQTLAMENSEPSFTCSIEQINHYVFALGLCGAFEQMRRAGVARILSPMRLTSEFTPEIELVGPE